MTQTPFNFNGLPVTLKTTPAPLFSFGNTTPGFQNQTPQFNFGNKNPGFQNQAPQFTFQNPNGFQNQTPQFQFPNQNLGFQNQTPQFQFPNQNSGFQNQTPQFQFPNQNLGFQNQTPQFQFPNQNLGFQNQTPQFQFPNQNLGFQNQTPQFPNQNLGFQNPTPQFQFPNQNQTPQFGFPNQFPQIPYNPQDAWQQNQNANLDIFSRPINAYVYKDPHTASYSSVASKLPRMIFPTIPNNFTSSLLSQQLLPPGIFLGNGRHSEKALEFLVRNANVNNLQSSEAPFDPGYRPSRDSHDHLKLQDFVATGQNPMMYRDPNKHEFCFDEFTDYKKLPSQFGTQEEPGSYRLPFPQTRYNREAVSKHLKNILRKITPKSQHFKDMKASLALEDDDNLEIQPYQRSGRYSDTTSHYGQNYKEPSFFKTPQEPLKRFYSRLPNSDGFFFRRRDLNRIPVDYLHETDLIEVIEPRTSFIQNYSPPRGNRSNHCGYVIAERSGLPYSSTRNSYKPKSYSLEEPNTINPLTLKSTVPWKKLSNSEKTKQTLMMESHGIGRNKRSLLDDGKIFRRMNRENYPSYMSISGQSTFENPFDFPPATRSTVGPPVKNDFTDFSELIQSRGMKPFDYERGLSLLTNDTGPTPANLNKRLTPLDMQNFADFKKRVSRHDMIINGPGRPDARVSRVGEINVIELIPKHSTGCETIFQKDWVTVEKNAPTEEMQTESDGEEENEQSSRSRRRRPRSRMTTAGHKNFRFKCGVTLTNSKYYCVPSIEQLHELTDEEGNCFVQGFEVGHLDFGNVVFPGKMNVAGLNLDTTIKFEQEEIVVYPNPDVAPAIGDGLNRPAIVTLEGIFPKEVLVSNISLGKPVESQLKKQSVSSLERSLRNACKKFNGVFRSYTAETGCWVFEVQHF